MKALIALVALVVSGCTTEEKQTVDGAVTALANLFTIDNTGGGLADNHVEAIAIDSAGGKWFGTVGGVSHLSADDTTWTKLTTAYTDGGLVDNYVNAIAIDSTKGKWFGTTGGGVSHLSADNTTRTTYRRRYQQLGNVS